MAYIGNDRKRIVSEHEILENFKGYIFNLIDSNQVRTIDELAEAVAAAYNEYYMDPRSGKTVYFKDGFRTRFGGQGKLNLFDGSKYMLNIINYFNNKHAVNPVAANEVAKALAAAAATRKGGRRRRRHTKRRRHRS